MKRKIGTKVLIALICFLVLSSINFFADLYIKTHSDIYYIYISYSYEWWQSCRMILLSTYWPFYLIVLPLAKRYKPFKPFLLRTILFNGIIVYLLYVLLITIFFWPYIIFSYLLFHFNLGNIVITFCSLLLLVLDFLLKKLLISPKGIATR